MFANSSQSIIIFVLVFIKNETMATVNFQLIGSNVYVNFSAGRGVNFRRKTGFVTNPEHWKQKKTKFYTKEAKFVKADLNSPTDADSKVLKSKLQDLEEYILSSYNIDFSSGVPISRDWLDQLIKKHTNQSNEEDEFLTYHIQKAIDNAPFKKIRSTGGKFKVGLSKGRIKGIIQFKNIIERFEDEHYKGVKIKVREINKETIIDFERWMFSKEYSINYIGKQQSNFKAILNELRSMAINIDIKTDIQVLSEDKEPEDLIYLSFEELERIKELHLVNEYQINARKWLILGCYLGQRVSDLLKLTPDKIKVLNDRKVFSIKQQKTGKKVTVPILPEADAIIETGFPRKISSTKLREYFKELCKLAGIDELKKGKMKDSSHGISKPGMYPKWQLVGTHVCRRSFASNFYGKIPTVVLKSITGHSTEQMFLKYIGKSNDDFAMQMFDYVEKLPKVKPLRIVRDSDNGNSAQSI